MNDLIKCWRRFHADIIKLYISALGHPMKLKFSSCVHLASVNQIFQYHNARMILYDVGEVYIFEHGLYISTLEQARMVILSNYVILESVNTNIVTLG